jgi:hypothetical protein
VPAALEQVSPAVGGQRVVGDVVAVDIDAHQSIRGIAAERIIADVRLARREQDRRCDEAQGMTESRERSYDTGLGRWMWGDPPRRGI